MTDKKKTIQPVSGKIVPRYAGPSTFAGFGACSPFSIAPKTDLRKLKNVIECCCFQNVFKGLTCVQACV